MVKAGYKQTEIGEIPEDWDVRRIGDSCTIFGRIGFRGYTKADIVTEAQGAISLSPSNIQDGKLTLERNTYISWIKWEESPEIKIENNDVLLVKTGSTVGKAALVKNLNEPATLNPQLVVFKKRKIEDRYLGYTVISENFQRQLTSTVVGGALPTLSQKEVADYKFPCPKTADEQKAIADALSDVDALIVSLEKLIEKKRDIKTATMQQLLTGKKRLSSFGDGKGTKQSELGEIPEDWDVRKYGDTFAFLSTANNSRADLSEDGDVEYIHYGDIHTKLHFKLDLERQTLPKIDRDKLRNPAFVADGDIVMADASEDYEGIGKSIEISNVGTRRVVSGLHTFLLRDTERRYADGFRGYLHAIPAIKRAFDTLATGLKVYGLSKNSLKNVSIPVPPFDEQVAIVKVISCMDNELHLLEEKLSKAKSIKQGMMQELLTGRTRLV